MSSFQQLPPQGAAGRRWTQAWDCTFVLPLLSRLPNPSPRRSHTPYPPCTGQTRQREARENQTGRPHQVAARPHQEFGEERVTWESLGLPEARKPWRGTALSGDPRAISLILFFLPSSPVRVERIIPAITTRYTFGGLYSLQPMFPQGIYSQRCSNRSGNGLALKSQFGPGALPQRLTGEDVAWAASDPAGLGDLNFRTKIQRLWSVGKEWDDKDDGDEDERVADSPRALTMCWALACVWGPRNNPISGHHHLTREETEGQWG